MATDFNSDQLVHEEDENNKPEQNSGVMHTFYPLNNAENNQSTTPNPEQSRMGVLAFRRSVRLGEPYQSNPE